MKIIDLSLNLYKGMPVFPGTPPVDFKQSQFIDKDFFNLGQAIINTHAGTHTDAPSHFVKNGDDMSKVSLNSYVGYATVVDLSSKKANDIINVEDIENYRESIERTGKVILRTDWYKKAGAPEYFTSYPKITVEATKYLIQLGIHMIGVEAPSLNPEDYIEVHQLLLGNKVAIIEGLANLDTLDKTEIFFVAPPLSFEGIDGIPVRAIAIELE